jgi:hypothetical protein
LKRFVQTFGLSLLCLLEARAEYYGRYVQNASPSVIYLYKPSGVFWDTVGVGGTGGGDMFVGGANEPEQTWTVTVRASMGGAVLGTLQLTSMKYGPYTVGATWTGATAPSPQQTNCFITRGFQNTSQLFYNRLDVTYRYGNGGAVQGYSTNVAPGAWHVVQLSGTGSNCPITLNASWQEGPLYAVSSTNLVTTNYVPAGLVTSNSLVADPIAWATPHVTNSPVTAPQQGPRATNFVDAASAVRSMDTNQDARARELASLMVSQSAAERQEAAALQATLAAAALQAATNAALQVAGLSNLASQMTNLNAAVSNLTGAFVNTNVPVVQAGWATNRWDVETSGVSNQVFALAGTPGEFAKTAPVITLPLNKLHSDLVDYSMDFGSVDTTYGSENLKLWAERLRLFMLFLVSVTFLIASFKVLGKAVWS